MFNRVLHVEAFDKKTRISAKHILKRRTFGGLMQIEKCLIDNYLDIPLK